MDNENALQIAKLNDEFRRSGFGITITQGVQLLGDISELLDEIRWFDQFDEANDPYGEHDFGQLEWYDQKIFWKIDYYDQTLTYGEDPLSPECQRVLTVMLASEY